MNLNQPKSQISFHKNRSPCDLHKMILKESKMQISKACSLTSRWLLRCKFQLPHPILSPALATDKKWPLSQFHIFYQNSEISWPKVPISDFQSQFSMSKIIRIFAKNVFIKEYRCFLLLIFFENFDFLSTLFNYLSTEFRVLALIVFDQWPKLNLGFDVVPEIRILKVIYFILTCRVSKLYRVFELDLSQIKRLLGHQKCTSKS